MVCITTSNQHADDTRAAEILKRTTPALFKTKLEKYSCTPSILI